MEFIFNPTRSVNDCKLGRKQESTNEQERNDIGDEPEMALLSLSFSRLNVEIS